MRGERVIRRIHPLLLAAAPVVFLYAHNAQEVAPQIAVIAVAIAIAGAGVMLAVAHLALGPGPRAGLVASVGVALFFLYGRVFDLVWGLHLINTSRSVHFIVTLLAAGVLYRSVRWLGQTKRDLEAFASALGAFGLMMLVFSSVDVVRAQLEAKPPRRPKVAAPRPPIITEERSDLPDIYFIILDGYARNDTLKKLYKLDNAPFWAALRRHGFFVAENSRSNYMMTHLSLAATLNLRYINDVIEASPLDSISKKPAYELIQTNEAAKFLQQQGYRYVHFCTDYGGTETSQVADTLIRYQPALVQSEFTTVLIRTTALRAWEPSAAGMNLFEMEEVQEVPKISGPTFAFVHFLLPHNPYIFDREGNVRSDVPMSLQFEEKTGGWSEKAQYVDQLLYLNRRVDEIVTTILRDSPKPPIIIIESDHGSASTYKSKKRWKDKFYPERTGILNAWYAPPEVLAKVTDNMHSVNTFRILFSTLFGADYPLLDRHIYASWYGKPNAIHEITPKLDKLDGVVPAE